jgi:hypothetical protein
VFIPSGDTDDVYWNTAVYGVTGAVDVSFTVSDIDWLDSPEQVITDVSLTYVSSGPLDFFTVSHGTDWFSVSYSVTGAAGQPADLNRWGGLDIVWGPAGDVPEPPISVLIGMGLAGMFVARRRGRHKR